MTATESAVPADTARNPEAAAETIADLASPDGPLRLYEHYHRLRAADPIHQSQHESFPDCWFISRHEDVYKILRDRRFVQDARNAEVFAGTEGAFADMCSRMLIFLPPGPHERTRGIIYRAFTPQAVARWESRIETVIRELIESAIAKGECELLHEVLYSLPMTVICELLGTTPDERAEFDRLFGGQGHEMSDVGRASDDQRSAADRMVEEFTELVAAMIKNQRDPDTVLATLIEATEDGDRLSTDEVIAAVYILIGAGHETTANLLGNGLSYLLGPDRDQWDRLVADPSLVPSAVEELMRYDTSVQFNQRVANEDVVYESAEGPVRIDENQRIIVLLGAANRDPAVFDNPDILDIARDPNPHLAFGAGMYYCLGANLARLEMNIALDALVSRVPNMELAAEPEFRKTWMMRGVNDLPVRF